MKKIQLLAALINPPEGTLEGQGGWRDDQEMSLSPNQCTFCQKEGHHKGECPEHPGVGCPRGIPDQPQFCDNFSNEIPVCCMVDPSACLSPDPT